MSAKHKPTLPKNNPKPWSMSLITHEKPAIKAKVEDRIQSLQKEIQDLKSHTRFTKMVELENEVLVYYQAYSKLKEEFKFAYDLDPVISKLHDYKNNMDTLGSRAKLLSQRNKELKETVKATALENSNLKKVNSELKREIKEISLKLNNLDHQNREVKRLQKVIKDFELEKVRMTAEFARSNKELSDLVDSLKEENQSKIHLERRKSGVFSRPVSIIDA